MEFDVICKIVPVDDYMRLRKLTLGEKTFEEAKHVINSWYGVYVVDNNNVIGAGRIIGDGALTFQITDIMVDPTYQGQGVGKLILKALMSYYETNAPSGSYMSLMADGDAKYLYSKFGFEELPNTYGMKYIKK